MVCIQCSSKTKVVNSRPQLRSNQVWRRRQCVKCQATFTSEEAVNYQMTWLVKSRSGALEPFSRDKLFLSLHKTCQHRKTALADAGALTETIIHKLSGRVSNGVIASREIVQLAQVALNRFDGAASVAYGAFHA